LDIGYRIDLLIEDSVIIEIKCVEIIAPIHKAQLLSYLRLTGKSLGLIINFHVEHLKDGIEGWSMVMSGDSLAGVPLRDLSYHFVTFVLTPALESNYGYSSNS
jgi:hypothetical protein